MTDLPYTGRIKQLPHRTQKFSQSLKHLSDPLHIKFAKSDVGSDLVGVWLSGSHGGGQGGEMTQTMYAHVNK
jgi:hypothetical protein